MRQRYVFFVNGKGFEHKTLFQNFSVLLPLKSGDRFRIVINWKSDKIMSLNISKLRNTRSLKFAIRESWLSAFSMRKNPCAIEWKPLPLSPETKGRSHGSHSKHKGIANPPTRHQRITNPLERRYYITFVSKTSINDSNPRNSCTVILIIPPSHWSNFKSRYNSVFPNH